MVVFTVALTYLGTGASQPRCGAAAPLALQQHCRSPDPRSRAGAPVVSVPLDWVIVSVLGRGRPLPRARRGDGPLQDLLGRPPADRVGQPGGAGRGGRLRLAAVARLGPGRRPPLVHVRLRAGAGRPGAAYLGGQHGMALRAQRGGPPRRGYLPSLQDPLNTF